jgi:hypothetical protein
MTANDAVAAAAAMTDDRALNAEISQAIADTEQEVFDDALGEVPLENDGDHSLEAMGDGLEGDDVDDDADGADGADDALEAIDEDDAEIEAADAQPQVRERDEQGRFVPTGVHRQEKERRRALEDENLTLRTQMNVLEARFNDLHARLNGPPQARPQQQQQLPPKPDMFAEPERYEQWLLDRASERSMAQIQQRMYVAHNQSVDHKLAQAAQGERAFEFAPAYNALMSLNPNHPQHHQLMRAVYSSPDPAGTLFQWWDQSGMGPQFRSSILRQLGVDPAASRGQRSQGGSAQQPRYVIRPGQDLPSLNSARGSNAQRNADPRAIGTSDLDVFNYATQR